MDFNRSPAVRRFRGRLISLSLLLMWAVRPASAITMIRIANQPVTAGQEGWIELQLDNPDNVAGVETAVLYDPSIITLIDPSGTPDEIGEGLGSMIPLPSVVVDYHSPDTPDHPGMKRIAFTISGARGTNVSGRLIRFKYRAGQLMPPDATTGLIPDSGPHAYRLIVTSTVNSPSMFLPAFIVADNPGVPFSKGDVDGDGRINLLDVVAVLSAVVGRDVLSGQAAVAADLNEDGKVDIEDARLLLRQVAGM